MNFTVTAPWTHSNLHFCFLLSAFFFLFQFFFCFCCVCVAPTALPAGLVLLCAINLVCMKKALVSLHGGAGVRGADAGYWHWQSPWPQRPQLPEFLLTAQIALVSDNRSHIYAYNGVAVKRQHSNHFRPSVPWCANSFLSHVIQFNCSTSCVDPQQKDCS